ncbi:MAG: alpha/beta fold hydrolase [Bdellovibrionales bacterium]
MHLDQFHHQILGSVHGPKVVFLHGLMGSGANWRKITARLEDAYHILLLDQRGHGRSFHPLSGYAPEDYADDLVKILDELKWGKVILVGHSMGGRNALNFSHRWPHRVIGLVLEDIGPNSDAKSAARIENLLAQVHTPYPSRLEAKKDILEEFPKRIAGNRQAATLAQFFYSNIEEKEDGTADWRFSKAGVLESLKEGRLRERWAEFDNLKMPTLVIRGEHSPDLGAPTFTEMLKRNPAVKGVVVPNAGHWVHSDQPELFIEALMEFFAALPH